MCAFYPQFSSNVLNLSSSPSCRMPSGVMLLALTLPLLESPMFYCMQYLVTNFRFCSTCLALAIKNACPMVRTVVIKGVCFCRPWSRSMGIARYCLLKQFFHYSSMVVSLEYVQIQITFEPVCTFPCGMSTLKF